MLFEDIQWKSLKSCAFCQTYCVICQCALPQHCNSESIYDQTIYHPWNKNTYKATEKEYLFHRPAEISKSVRLSVPISLPFYKAQVWSLDWFGFCVLFQLWTQSSMSSFALLLLLTITGPFNDYSYSVSPWDFNFFSFLLSYERFFFVLWLLTFHVFWICQFCLLVSVPSFCSLLPCQRTVWQVTSRGHRKEWPLLLVVWSSLVSVCFQLGHGGTFLLPPHAAVNSIQKNNGLNQNCARSSLHVHGRRNNKGGSNNQWLERGFAAKTYWVGTSDRLQSACMKHWQRDYLLCFWMKP